MKKLGILLSVAIAASSAVMLTSCGDYVGKEKTHPLFIKAGTAKNAGNYQEAAKYLEEFLTICPKSAETHFRLASLYGDNLDEPLKAVYHYRKYLELAPNDTTNADDINGFTELAKKRLYEKLKEEYKDNSANIALNEDLEKTKERLNKYVEYSKALETQNQQMKQRLREIAAQRSAPARKPQAATETPTAPAVAAGAAGTTSSVSQIASANGVTPTATATSQGTGTTAAASAGTAAGAKLGSYTVKAGDTLIGISRKIYGSPRYYKLIADANKGVIPASMQVRVGQVIKIPQLPSRSR